MTNPSNSAVQNLLPVQAYFDAQNNFITFIGQGVPFYASVDPSQSGLNITNSTINSTTIGAVTPSTGVFTNIATTTGTISTAATGPTDIVNKQYVDYFAAGLSWKAPAITATGANITLSGLQTINGVTVVDGDTVLVKNQTNAAENGIYVAHSGAWTYAIGGDTWSEYVGAIIFIIEGALTGSAWYCTAQPGGTLGVTNMVWSNFSVASSYTAGTGLQLIGTQFSIANTGVAANTYGSATATPVFAVNAQGQITSVTNTTITPAIGNVTGLATGIATFLSTPTSANLAAAVSDETGSGALVFATSPTLVTPLLGTPTSGILTNCTGLPLTTGVTGALPILNGGTGQTTASAAFNALSPITTAGDLILGTGVNTAGRLGIGTNGQVLTSNGTTASWASPSPGTTFSGGTTGLTPNTPTSGTVTLGGTLNVSNGGTGLTTLTASYVPYGNGTSAFQSSSQFQYNGTYLLVGAAAALGGLTNPVAAFTGNPGTTNYIQTYCYNSQAGISSSADFVAYANNSTDAHGWADMGFTSSVYADAVYTVTGPNEAYLFGSALNSSFTGNLVYATDSTGSANAHQWYVGGFTQAKSAWKMQLTSTGLQLANALGAAYGGTGVATLSGIAYGNGTSAFTAATAAQVVSVIGTTAVTNATNAVNTGITDDTTTATTCYPTWVTTTSGNLPQKVASTKLSFVPSTGVLSATTFSGAGTSLTGTGASFTAGTANALATANNYQVNSLGVGTAGSGTAGEIRATNNITAYYSDERLKTKIGNIENPLDKVRQIETMMYHANETAVALGYDASIIEVGVTAQSVQKVMPQTVAPAPIDDKYLTVRYERLVPLLIEAIKELEAKVNLLQYPKTGA